LSRLSAITAPIHSARSYHSPGVLAEIYQYSRKNSDKNIANPTLSHLPTHIAHYFTDSTFPSAAQPNHARSELTDQMLARAQKNPHHKNRKAGEPPTSQ
jgi:hypothetical protein